MSLLNLTNLLASLGDMITADKERSRSEATQGYQHQHNENADKANLSSLRKYEF